MESLNFRKIMRGYDPDEVDNAYAELQHKLDEANASNRELRLQINSLREQNAEWGNRLKSYEGMEKDLRDAMLSAQRVAGQVKDNAEQDAQTLLENAKNEVETLLHESTQRAEQRVAELKEEEIKTEASLNQLQDQVSELTLEKEALEIRMEKASAQLELLRQTLEL
ncbi:DivIVA domain-containing protein [Desulfitobacterium metallireducens]|uniref:Cell division protein DivIVA n=1 Tax=Desulfitobacterium metallireducens DSM 15288 TaxID=871968 RepID=W0ECT4_9FIRM|nr:DivIVA domain-containing protein [Desulfitobacterium metallireducens]AHF06886.1 cell division protein DivIVA [Desulfitobacterium metallireducens DSM 15288]